MEETSQSFTNNCHCALCQGVCPCNGVEKYFQKFFELQVPITHEAKTLLLDNLLQKYKEDDALFKSEDWKMEIFSKLESDLFQFKSLLNSFKLNKWNGITYSMDVSIASKKHTASLFSPLTRHTLTVTWSKLRELLVKYHDDLFKSCIDHDRDETANNQSHEYKTLHLCEMPGSFVRSVRFYIEENFPKVQHKWLATSLNHYHEQYDLLAAEFVNYRNISQYDYKNWFFLESDKGDLLGPNELFKAVTDTEQEDGKSIVRHHFDLVTCDGGVNCEHDPAKQEKDTFPLKFAEVITALVALKRSGCLIVKFYSIFECNTICLVYLMYLLFEKIHITKPFMSKRGNSEVYLVCLNYQSTEQIDQKAFRTVLDNAIRHVPNIGYIQEGALFDKFDVDQKFLEALYKLEEQVTIIQSYSIQQSVEMAKKISDNPCCSLNLERIRHESLKLFISKNKLDCDTIEEHCRRYDNEVINSILNIDHENFLENPLSVYDRMIHGKPLRRLKNVLNYDERVKANNWTPTRFALDIRSLPKIICDSDLARLCRDVFSNISYVDMDVSANFMQRRGVWMNTKFVDFNTIDFKSIKSSKFSDVYLLNLWINLKVASERLAQTKELKLRQEEVFDPLKSRYSNLRSHPFNTSALVLGMSVRRQIFAKLLRSSQYPYNGGYHIMDWSDVFHVEKKTISDSQSKNQNVGMSSLSCLLGLIKQLSPSSKIHVNTINLDGAHQDANSMTSEETLANAEGSINGTYVHIVPIQENEDDNYYHEIHDEWLICNKLVSTLTKILSYELVRENSTATGDTLVILTLPHMLTRATVGLLFLLHNSLFKQFAIIPRLPFQGNRRRSGSDSQNWRDKNQATTVELESDNSLNQFVIMKSTANDKGSKYRSDLEGVLSLLNNIENTLSINPNLRLLELVSTPFILANKSFFRHIYAANFVRTLVECGMIKSIIYDNIEAFKRIRLNDPNFAPHLILFKDDNKSW